MFKESIGPQWQLEQADGWQPLPRLVELLVGVRDTEILAEACVRAHLSYRCGRNLLREGLVSQSEGLRCRQGLVAARPRRRRGRALHC